MCKGCRTYILVCSGDEVGGIRGIAESGGDMEGRGYVRGPVEVIVGVNCFGCRGQGGGGEG